MTSEQALAIAKPHNDLLEAQMETNRVNVKKAISEAKDLENYVASGPSEPQSARSSTAARIAEKLTQADVCTMREWPDYINVQFTVEQRDFIVRAVNSYGALVEALRGIVGLECEPFKFPPDWHEQIEACSECQRYKDHPIQQGICNLHRMPIYAHERHDDHQQRTLIYRAQDIARAALSLTEEKTI